MRSAPRQAPLAQLVRAIALYARGSGFESLVVHQTNYTEFQNS